MSKLTKNLFAWASISEKGTINGIPGDQTGKEVRVGNYYDFGQDAVIRVKPLKTRRKIAKIAKEMALCNQIGYGQRDRDTLFDVCKAANWDWNLVKNFLKRKPVNCDCSMFCAMAVNMGFGKQIFPKDVYTGNMESYARKHKDLTVVSLRKFKSSPHKADMPLKAEKHVIINI